MFVQINRPAKKSQKSQNYSHPENAALIQALLQIGLTIYEDRFNDAKNAWQ